MSDLNVTTVRRAEAEDALKDSLVDSHYIDKGNYNRAVTNDETRDSLPTRSQVVDEIHTVMQGDPRVANGEMKPMDAIIQDISTGLDSLLKLSPETYETTVDELVAERDFRNSFPKEADFANVMLTFDSIWGFGMFYGRESNESDGFKNFDADFLMKLKEESGKGSNSEALDAIFTIGWKGLHTSTILGKYVDPYSPGDEKTQAQTARALFDAKIANLQQIKKSGVGLEFQVK